MSQLALGWAVLAVCLSLLLPEPVATWVAILSVVAAALSVVMGQSRRRRRDVAAPSPASAMQESGLLETAALVVRSCVHAHDLPKALHGVAGVLFEELGAQGLLTGQLDDAGAMRRLDRFADQAGRLPAPPRGAMSPIAADATANQRITGSIGAGLAVPVLRHGRCVAWLEFRSLQMTVDAVALMRLLDIVRLELSSVADRCPALAGIQPVGAAGAMQHDGGTSRPVPDSASDWPHGQGPVDTHPLRADRSCDRADRADRAEGGPGATDGDDVLDSSALDRLRELDPSGANRLLERVLKAFETSATRQIPRLRDALLNEDTEAVRQVAHALRGASASVGATKLARLCAELEDPAFDPRIESLETHLKSMFSEIDRVLSVLRSQPVKHP